MKLTAPLAGLPPTTRKVVIWTAAVVLLFVAVGLIRGKSRVDIPTS